MHEFDRENGEPFRVDAAEEEDRIVLTLAGEINLDAARRVHGEAVRLVGSNKDWDLDWSAAGRLSAGAVQVLLVLAAALSGRGRALRVTGDQPAIRESLKLAGLADRFVPAEAPAK